MEKTEIKKNGLKTGLVILPAMGIFFLFPCLHHAATGGSQQPTVSSSQDTDSPAQPKASPAQTSVLPPEPKTSTAQPAPTATIAPSKDAELGKGSPPKLAATITIAASNSSPETKARADYVCDGVDDHVEIQAAIDSLPETRGAAVGESLADGTYWRGIGGGTIELSAGVFHIGAKLNLYDKVVNLIGTGKYSTALMLQKGVNDDMILIGLGKQGDVPAGRIAHMTLDGASEFQTKGSGIRAQTGLGIVIEDVRIYNFREDGIHLQMPAPDIGSGTVGLPAIVNCRIEYNKKNGIYIGSGTEGGMIRGCWINDNGTVGEPYYGIYIHNKPGTSPANGHAIVGCMLWQNRYIQVGINGPCTMIQITGCLMLSSPYEILKVWGGGHIITVTGNSFHSASELELGFLGGGPHVKKIFEGKKAVPYITLGESPTSTAKQVVISSNAFAVPTPEHGHRQTPPVEFPQPSAILEEHPGSDYNKFIGNVIQGIVTTVIMVGPHSSSDI